MKKPFAQLKKTLPSKKVIFTYNDFSLPFLSYSILIETMRHLSKKTSDIIVFIAPQKELKLDFRISLLNKAFPGITFIPSDSLTDIIQILKTKYNSIIACDVTIDLNKYNIESINTRSRNPEFLKSDAIKFVKQNDINSFKKLMMNNLSLIDIKKMINELRQFYGLSTVDEEFIINDTFRDDFILGKIFNENDIVESNDIVYMIKKKGTNHLLLQSEDGQLVNKWLTEVKITDKEFKLQEVLLEMKFTSSDKIKVARIIATSLGIEDVDNSSNPENLVNAALRKIRGITLRPEYLSVLRKMLKTATDAEIKFDKNLIPKQLSENFEQLEIQPADINSSIKKKHYVSDYVIVNGKKVHRKAVEFQKKDKGNDLGESVKTAKELALELVKRRIEKNKKESESNSQSDYDTVEEFPKEYPVGHTIHAGNEHASTRRMKIQYTKEEIEENVDLDDDDLENIAKQVKDVDDILPAYDSDELALVDSDTGDHVEDLKEEVINEILSREERIKARIRFARTEPQRERKIQLALKMRSTSSTINKRARRLAEKILKEKIARKPLAQMTVAEKERVEQILAKRKALVNRLALKLVTRIRTIENNRLNHPKFTN